MRKSKYYALYVGITLGLTNISWAILPQVETETTIATAIKGLAPQYKVVAADAITSATVYSPTAGELDGARISTVATVAGSEVLWDLDGSTNLRTMSFVGGAWRTFKGASLAATWSATTTVTLTEDVRDGTSSPASPYTMSLVLTKTGTVADLTQANLMAFLLKVTTKSLLTTAGGTTLATTGATGTVPTLSSGWAAKSFISDGSSAITAATLDPIQTTLSLTVTPTTGVDIAYTANLINLYNWNLATNSTTTEDVLFNGPGRNILLKTLPAKSVRTAGISTGLITNFNALQATNPRINQTISGFLNSLANAVAEPLALFDTSPPADLKTGFGILAKQSVTSAAYVVGRFTTTADTSKYGMVALTPVDITTVTWSSAGTIITATGKLGTAPLKKFTCDLNGIEVVKAASNAILEFSAPDGDKFWIKALDTTGIDLSADTSVAAGNRDDLLALQLTGKFASVVTIDHQTLKAMITKSQ